ncbi:acetoacetate decarboxylase family protein [Phenylobacterium sp.]|uniref:acetoacetate decarboxylase family protein n=1 Tax=Phenylobacterium sp. TaxID=1871053 RepID=UPI0025CDB68B|nr:acetoacetate decarboxylase family protein [Phenylobacterium sp.]MCA6225484.1 acetoacetate decarboxylase family protein [Phenylobacterium sp.]MCA6248594.1 acetoacetate decarboxylase family protein [Phenylobacterium sp.]
MLLGWTLPQTSTGRSSTVSPPPWHYSGEVIAVEFRADPDRVAALAPPGFEPEADGSCTFVFCDWCSAADSDPRTLADPARSQYREAFVIVTGEFRGVRASRIPFIWVDSELSLLRGHIQGFPKQIGQVHMTRPVSIGKGGVRLEPGASLGAHVSSLGRRLATARVELHEKVEIPPLALFAPPLHTRLFPSLSRPEPAVEEFSIGQVSNAAWTDVWRGAGDLSFGESEYSELDQLAPTEIIAGWRLNLAFSVDGAVEFPMISETALEQDHEAV